jgi:hypothetical protein
MTTLLGLLVDLSYCTVTKDCYSLKRHEPTSRARHINYARLHIGLV